nr:hypothetical protein [Gammaproteobacteria bacterium]
MKKLLTLFLMITCLFGLVSLSGCSKEKRLPNPRGMDIVDDYFIWDPVEGADGYLIYFNDDLSDRFYTVETELYMYDDEIVSSLKSGEDNYMFIRAINLDKNNLPVNVSDRSLIIFNFSRQLNTPNKVGYKNEKFSWRSVSDAKDYKALVKIEGEDEGKLYDMDWSTGTSSVTGTIKDLPDGQVYHVSIVAV